MRFYRYSYYESKLFTSANLLITFIHNIILLILKNIFYSGAKYLLCNSHVLYAFQRPDTHRVGKAQSAHTAEPASRRSHATKVATFARIAPGRRTK